MSVIDHETSFMRRAMANAQAVRPFTSPNPWVGAVVVSLSGRCFDGATQPPGGKHAEIVALDKAGPEAVGATLYTTLEPCSHQGRTGPCSHTIVGAGVTRVVIGVRDPDQKVAGTGLAYLRAHGVEVVEVAEEVLAAEVAEQLAPYLHHRRTGRPWVVLKLAATLDGRTAAADGTSQWITGERARTDAHRLRGESDAVLVGAGTVREDDPALTVRLPDVVLPESAQAVGGPSTRPWRQPRRIVLGRVAASAQIRPCDEWLGSLDELLDSLGADGILQLMVEGGAAVAASFHGGGLVNRYVLYLAPALMGNGKTMFDGLATDTIENLWRGNIVGVRMVGGDIRLDVAPA